MLQGRASRWIAVMLFLGTAAVLTPGAAIAQVIAGYVRDGGTGQPVDGAFVQLLAGAAAPPTGRNSVLAAALSDSTGFYALRAPTAGTYRLRIERIGYATITRGPVRVAAAGSVAGNVALSPQAFALPRLEAQATRRCVMRPAEGEAIYGLWQAARRALRVAAWTAREAGLFFKSQTYARRLDADGMVLRQQVHTTWNRGRPPFGSLSADSLLKNGFIQPSRHGGYVFYGPDPSVILSDGFLDTHCFRLATSSSGGDVGLAFEPGRGATRYNVEGTLWLDRATGALDSLTFTFTNTPWQSMGSATGTMDFRRAPTGAWIIRTWQLRFPLQRLDSHLIPSFAGYSEQGGRVEEVYSRLGQRITLTRSATLLGEVRDTAGGVPLAGARVLLLGTGRAATTDAAGRFLFPPLLPGHYLVAFTKASLDSLGWRASAVPVTLEPGRTDTLRLVAPSATELAALRRRRSLAVVAGQVLDVATGQPVAGAAVRLSGVSAPQVTDSLGGFRFDTVPPGLHRMAVQQLGYGTRSDTLELKPGERVSVRFRVAARPIALAPIVVEGERTSLSEAMSQRVATRLGGFYMRRALGMGGKFIGPKQVAAHPFEPLTHLLEDYGIRFHSWAHRISGGCPLQYYVDGFKTPAAALPEDVVAVEAYTGAYAPPQFMGPGSDCGVVVLWTRQYQAATDSAADTISR